MVVNGYDISIIRGDSESLTVRCYDAAGQPLPFVEDEIVYFTVKLRYTDTEYVLQKVITEFDEGAAIIEISPEDTKGLYFSKDYYYDIQLTRADGSVTTIVPCSIFRLGVEITDD